MLQLCSMSLKSRKQPLGAYLFDPRSRLCPILCSSSYKPVRCHSVQCNMLTWTCRGCFSGPMPGNNESICHVYVNNGAEFLHTTGEVAQDVVSIQCTSG
ncbi:hypothetical protein V6N13_016021 [Hibiscus sabdariffa]|uniref:Xylanase inhibitor N-terminal domain-containing protein n=1 Tax=Hibiscus sabdariffa TaxID=183260 RepID=A0ABR2CY69_9ROSI